MLPTASLYARARADGDWRAIDLGTPAGDPDLEVLLELANVEL
jgi:hypothetical protein